MATFKVYIVTKTSSIGYELDVFESYELAVKFILGQIEDHDWSIDSEVRCNGIIFHWFLHGGYYIGKTLHFDKFDFRISSYSVRGNDQLNDNWQRPIVINKGIWQELWET